MSPLPARAPERADAARPPNRLAAWFALGAAEGLSFPALLGIALQLCAVVFLARRLKLESAAFYEDILPLALGGFVVHWLLPRRARLPFFVVLSLSGIVLVLGSANAAWAVGIVLGLVGIARLPMRLPARVALLGLCAIGLALLRLDILHAPFSLAVWPVAASFVMFRLVVYMYDLEHGKAPSGFWQTLAYFFLLPNVLFPLFPVVDSATFRRACERPGDAALVAQRGALWMARGALYMLLYRVTYQMLTTTPADVKDAGGLALYMVTNYLLLLRILGQFEIVIGMLLIFGFDLPAPNVLNFLASSFTDFWRRSNTYWRDFALKVFYYPAYFRVRRLGNRAGLIAATLFVFVVTWLLHAYQWFWILGSWRFSLPDTLFWLVFSGLLIANLLREMKHPPKKSLSGTRLGGRELAVLSLKILGTFATISVLWTLWTSPTLSDFWTLLKSARVAPSAFDSRWLGAIGIAAAATAAGAVQVRAGASRARSALVGLASAAVLLALAAAASIGLYARLGMKPPRIVWSIRDGRLNEADASLLTRGYYENLLSVNRLNTQLWEVYSKRPVRWRLMVNTDLIRGTNDFLKWELRPKIATLYRNKPFHTNRWGMRDRDYELAKPAGVLRVAVLGGSHAMGSGVADGETFEALLEERLNRERSADRRIEVLDFAVEAYSAVQNAVALEKKALRFSPDIAILVSAREDVKVAKRHVAERVRLGAEVPVWLAGVVAKSRIEKGMAEADAASRIEPFGVELVTRGYQRVAELCREHGIVPVYVYLATADDATPADSRMELIRPAADAGFLVLDLSDVYRGLDVKALMVSDFDRHPSDAAHKIVADRLYAELRAPGRPLAESPKERK